MMRPTTTSITSRVAANLVTGYAIRPLVHVHACAYATQSGLGTASSPAARRRAVTPLNDDGFVPWKELSGTEKAARATQQSYNFGMVLIGLILTGGVSYFLWTDVFSPDSKTAHFNRAVDKIKKDQRCIQLLGDAKKMTAHGEETMNKWRRARPVASTERTDPNGTQHFMMHFHIDGPKTNGVAQLHMVKAPGQSDFEYRYLFVDVKGQERIYIEKADRAGGNSGKKPFSFLGLKLG